MRGEDVLVLLWVLTVLGSVPESVSTISDVDQELPYVQSVKENEHCFSTSPGVSGDRTTCSAGYHRGKFRDCEFCQLNYTFQPYRNDCEKCILCSECDDGFRMETPCTRTADTVCVESATISPTTEDVVQATTVEDITTAWLSSSTDPVTQEESLCSDLEPPDNYHILPAAWSLRVVWKQPIPVDEWYTILCSDADGNATHEEHITRRGEDQWVIANLEPCTIYHVQIRVHSPNCSSAFTSPKHVKTACATFFPPIPWHYMLWLFLQFVVMLILAALARALIGFIRLCIKRWKAQPAPCPGKAAPPLDQPLLDRPPGPDNSRESDPPVKETAV